MGSIGFPEMIFIFVLALLIFGPKKLPELGRSLGKGLSEFRRASSELRNSLEREMQNIEQDTKVEEPSQTAAKDSPDPSKTSTVEQEAYEEQETKVEEPCATAAKDSAEASPTSPVEQEAYKHGGYSGERQD